MGKPTGLDVLRRLEVMRIGGPTADGRNHFNGSLSSEEWIVLVDALTNYCECGHTAGCEKYIPSTGELLGLGLDDEW